MARLMRGDAMDAPIPRILCFDHQLVERVEALLKVRSKGFAGMD